MNFRRIAGQLLSSYLLIWAPGTFAVELMSALPSMGMRGPRAWLELAIHGLVAVFCAIAGRMIRIAAPAALAAAAIAVGVRAAASLQSLFWTTLPSDVAPGAQLPAAILVCVNAAFWLFVIRRLNPR
jgi:hypothetical protein